MSNNLFFEFYNFNRKKKLKKRKFENSKRSIIIIREMIFQKIFEFKITEADSPIQINK